MIYSKKLLQTTCAAASLVLGMSEAVFAQTQFPADAKQSCVLSPTEFDNSKSIGVLPITKKLGPFYDSNSGLVYIFPTNGPSFKSDGNCDFYKWGSQMFLWLTSTVTDVAKDRPANSQAPSAETRFVFGSEFFYGVEKNSGSGPAAYGKKFVAQGAGQKPLNGLVVKRTKPIDAESVAQAGEVSGVLISQGSKGKNNISNASSLVYYAINTNRLFGYFRNNSVLTGDTNRKFPTESNEVCALIDYALAKGYAKKTNLSEILFDKLCVGKKTDDDIAAFKDEAKATGNVIPQLETAIDYLSMALEIKTSWVEADTLANPEKYIRQWGEIPVYNKGTARDAWINTGEVKVKELALVGMHIVGSVKGHPELIWATIEHVDNTPNQKYSYATDATGTESKTSTINEITSNPNGNWLFSDGTSNSINAENLSVNDNSDIVSASGDFGPANVNRILPWGNVPGTDAIVPSQSEKNNAMLISLNSSVISNVKKEQITDPRQFYFLAGAVWTNNGSIPTSNSSSAMAGSTQLSNSTLETFKQNDGCFSCHSAYPKTKPNSVSHIFSNMDPKLPKYGN